MNIRNILAKKYGGDDWIFLEEVRDRPGFNARRSADAVAMGLWESRGLELIAFEIKEYRSDWLRELKRPEKADPIFKLVDRFYLVSSPDVAKIDEIPAAWGWLEQQGNRLIERRKAPLISTKPALIDRTFAATLLKRAKAGMPTDKQRVEELAQEMAADKLKAQAEAHEAVKAGLSKQVASLQEELAHWTRLSGCRFYPGKEVTEAFKILRDLVHNDFDESGLVLVANIMQEISKSIRELRPALLKAREVFRKELENVQHQNPHAPSSDVAGGDGSVHASGSGGSE